MKSLRSIITFVSVLYCRMIAAQITIHPRDLVAQRASHPASELVEQMKPSNALLFRLDDGKFGMVPALGKFALIAASKDALIESLENGTMPVGLETDDPFEAHQDLVDQLGTSPADILHEFSSILNDTSLTASITNLEQISSRIEHIQLDASNQSRAAVVIILFLHELIRSSANGTIDYKTVPTLRTYRRPLVLGSNGTRIDCTKDAIDSIRMTGKINMLVIYRRSMAKYYRISPLDKAYDEFLRSGTIRK